MQVQRALLFAFGILVPAVAAAHEDCPQHFKDYGFFLQAKKSCGKEIAYPLMKIMKACAKQTPQEAAVALMDDGRRAWARNLMRSNLGSLCEEALSKLSASTVSPKRR
ncbi:hypothetical protein [Methylobacterium sp.]|jgi:hypothetical protein|uniref:hypothetical protein n=1 Tax=Methylobacterium sp. TaxID=409 RepID=UPI0025F14726|nr:hypothetical protein [Methylobacterium sp.]MBY0257016.1 hypothetical protein [Methylobacterium sp.]